MKPYPLYLSYLGIAVVWFVTGVLGGWALRGNLSVPSWNPIETPLSNLTTIGICTIPHVLMLGFVLSLILSFFYPKVSVTVAALPIAYSVGVGLLLGYSIFRPQQPTDVLRKIYQDPQQLLVAEAAFKQDKETVSKFIQQGGSLEFTTENGLTPLMFAAKECDWKTVQFLLEMGAKVNTPTDIKKNQSALLLLWSWPHPQDCLSKTSDLLLKAGADRKSFRSDLMTEVVRNAPSTEFLDIYLDQPTQEELNDLARTAVYFDRFESFEYLLKKGADPYWKPNEGKGVSAFEKLQKSGRKAEKDLIQKLKLEK